MVPEILEKFIEAFSKLPNIGPRQALRLAFHLAALDQNETDKIEKAVAGFKFLDRCSQCFFFKEKNQKLCRVCRLPNRDPQIIAIVEKETDLLTLEKTGRFRGHYLVLGELAEKGSLEPIQKLRLQALKNRIKKDLNGQIEEIVVALNPTTFADFTAELIKEEFKTLTKKISRLGRGIPTGGEIEFADEETIRHSLERRS
ncbi:MAG: toprim domain-containing protein [bacterium]|nr:toprim domain-containing protein [bacterium]